MVIWRDGAEVPGDLTGSVVVIGNFDGVHPGHVEVLAEAHARRPDLPLVVVTGKWSNPLLLPGRTQLFLVLSALATGASWLFYFRALQSGELAKVAVVDKFSVVLVIVLAYLLLGERPSLREWSGIGLVLAGVIVLATKK